MIRRFLPLSPIPTLVPIGPDRDSVRRVPVVTLTIAGLCAVVLLIHQLAGIPTEAEKTALHDAGARAIDFWTRHPELEAPRYLDEIFELLPESQQAALGELEREGRPEAAEPAAEDLQAQLDALWDDVVAAIPDDPRAEWGFRAASPSAVQAITHMFTHADWGHLLWNMLFLFVCGVLLEDVWGRGAFLGFYVLAGLAAALPDLFLFSDEARYSIGASGAISGVMGAFAVRFWNVRMRLVLLVWTFSRPVLVSSWLILVFWFSQDVAAIPEQFFGGHVDHVAHVAGFAFGATFALAMRRFRVEERQLAALVESKSARPVVSNPEIERAIHDLRRERPETAWRRLAGTVRRDPDNVDVLLALWDLSHELGREADAAEAMARAVRLELRAGDLENATAHWRELAGHVPDVTLDAPSLIRISRGLAERGLRHEAVETLRLAFEDSDRRLTGASLLQLATLAADLDASLSEAAARDVLARLDASIQEKADAAALLRRSERGRVTVSCGASE